MCKSTKEEEVEEEDFAERESSFPLTISAGEDSTQLS